MNTTGEYARSCVADAIDVLEHLTTDEFSVGGDREARSLLVQAMVALGSPAETWEADYPDAVRRTVNEINGLSWEA